MIEWPGLGCGIWRPAQWAAEQGEEGNYCEGVCTKMGVVKEGRGSVLPGYVEGSVSGQE